MRLPGPFIAFNPKDDMAVLDAALISQLNQLMDRVTHPVELVMSLDDRPESAQISDMLEQVAALSANITVRRDDAAHDRRPAFSITRPGSDISITFAALPTGHEFNSFVLALLQVGGNPVKLDEKVVAGARAITTPKNFVTYISLTCQNCPTVVQAINAMAVLNPLITNTVVDGSLFRDEVEAEKIKATPTMYLNGELFGQGRMEAAQILSGMDSDAGASMAAELSSRKPYQVLVVGQGPAGVASAIYLARKGIRTALIGDRFGGQVNDTLSIENVISVPHTEGPKLASDLRTHASQYEIDMIDGVRAAELLPATDGDDLVGVRLEGDARLSADAVVLATGAHWRQMGVPGEQEYRNKGVTYCPHCDGPLFKGKDVAVIGGGNSGIEAALDLAGVARHVTVVEFMPACKADEVLLDRVDQTTNITVLTNSAVTEVVGDGSQVTGLHYDDRATGEHRELALDGVFVQIGLMPNTDWLKGAVKLDAHGQIVIDDRGATNVPRVFAAGDCTDVPFKQIIVAEGAGAIAGLSAWESLIREQSTAAPKGSDVASTTGSQDARKGEPQAAMAR
ncbi:alkyl hydroperoxide reductase subunit F [Propionibacterium freudenreichii]|nr:alkyl hydroperoxide reductase subunit F [Propionibacterium freudenreichii]MCT2992859.1 alkyl hydroperoxide reductase subunit F [Propionibacterium freudenreichii]MDK9342269.1 alkyl hydroperoxide reductase subunit F [Propionibacterium freudenreichii]MDK9651148.1 alkyl hydroperoxide reductase subunit F [Propionibacterium freudenreichii]MDK9664433.1 alkyl hydroperoxide reductase subunit F [Propionibacterium freudenreichii]